MTLTRRRALFGASLIVPAALLAGCATSTSGTTTTVTVDVAKINTYVQSLSDAATAILAAPAIIALLGANDAIAMAALTGLKAGSAAVLKLTGGTVSASIDTASVKAAAETVLDDGRSFLSLLQSALSGSTNKTAVAAENYASAFATVLPLLSLAIGLASATRTAVLPMTEAQALAVLRSR